MRPVNVFQSDILNQKPRPALFVHFHERKKFFFSDKMNVNIYSYHHSNFFLYVYLISPPQPISLVL